MNVTLSTADADRLAKLLGMLGSEHDGERASAGLLAHKLIRERGLTWPEIICPRQDWHEPTDPRDLAEQCGRYPATLTPWERKFLAEIATGPRPPSVRQLWVLREIAARVRAAVDLGKTAS